MVAAKKLVAALVSSFQRSSSLTARHYRAVQVTSVGGPEVLRLSDLPSPPLPSNSVRVSTRSIGVNYHDTYTRTGLYPQPLPFTVGCEASGVVTDVGPDVDASVVKKGDSVAFFEYGCAYATEAVVPATSCYVLPDGVPFELGAASLVQGLTAHYLAHDSYRLEPGSVCVVHAAGGGTGNLLVQMAKLRGATVIATSSAGAKAAAAREAGADHVIIYDESYDFLNEVRGIAPDGVDCVFDSIGRATAEDSLRCLRPRGTCVLYGNSSGAPGSILPTPTLASNSLYLHRPVLQHFLRTEEERRRRSKMLFDWLRDGSVRVRIARTFPLAETAEAHRFLESRLSLGKVMIDPCCG